MNFPHPSYSDTQAKSTLNAPFPGNSKKPDTQDSKDSHHSQARLQNRESKAKLLDYEDEEDDACLLPAFEAQLVDALLYQLNALKPPLANKRGDLVHLFKSMKDDHKTIKALLSDYSDTKEVRALQQQLARLTHDLQAALQSEDKSRRLDLQSFQQTDIQIICQGLTLCVPVSGTGLFKQNNSNHKALQAITSALLERAMQIGLPEGVAENGQVLDILNWVSHGLKAGLLQRDDTITKVFTRSLVLLESWSEGDHSEQLLSDHNVGKCAVQIQTMYNEGLVDLDWKNSDGNGLDNLKSLKQCALNFCAPATLHHLIKSGDTVSLLNICNTVKDFIKDGLLTKTDEGLLPALRALVTFIGKLPDEALIGSDGDCRALSNFSNFLRTLAEQKSNQQPLFTGELPQFDATCARLVACINSKAFEEAEPDSQALSNLVSFIKLCGKRLAPDSKPDEQTPLINAAACLTQKLMAIDPADYVEPHAMSGLLAGLAYLWESNLIVRSDTVKGFMQQLVAQAGNLSAPNWTNKSRKIVLPHLQMLFKENVLVLTQMQPALRHILGVQGEVTLATLIASSKRLGAVTDVVVPLPLLTKVPSKETAIPAVAKDKPAEKMIPGQTQLRAEKAGTTMLSTNSLTVATAPSSSTYRGPVQAKPKKLVSKTPEIQTSSAPTFHTEPVVSVRPTAVIPSQKRPRNEASATTPVKQKPQSPDEKKASVVATAKQKPQTLPVEQKSLPVKNASGRKAPEIKPVQTKQKQTAGATAKSDKHSQIMQAIMQGKLETVKEIMVNQGKWSETEIHLFLNAFFTELDLIDNKIIIAFDTFIKNLIEKQGKATLPLLKQYFEKNPPQFSGISEKLIERGIIQKKNNALPAPHATKPDKNKTIPTDEYGKNALMYVCRSGDLNTVLKLLGMGNVEEQVMQKSINGFNALMYATFEKNNNIANLLLTLDSKDKQTAATDNVGWNALIHAISVGNTEIASLLLAMDSKDKQAEPTDKVGWNALMHAIYEENTEIASSLLALDSKDKQATAINKDGWNALMLAINKGYSNIASSLLTLDSKNEQAIAINKDGWNALMLAIDNRYPDIASSLLTLDSKEAQACVINKNGWNPLMLAIDRGYTDLAASLLTLDSKNIQAKTMNKDGWNALMFAKKTQNTTVIEAIQALTQLQ